MRTPLLRLAAAATLHVAVVVVLHFGIDFWVSAVLLKIVNKRFVNSVT